MPTSNKGPLAGSDLGDDRIYSISDVSEALGIGRQTASRIGSRDKIAQPTLYPRGDPSLIP